MISEADWLRNLTRMGVRDFTAAKWMVPFASEMQPEKFSQGMDDIRALLPQILHETDMLENMREKLRYNPERICAVWPRRFPTLASAIPCSMNAERLANTVYANRMGNGDYASGDGYRFSGAGPPMLTGRGAYRFVGNLCGQDLENMPDLILQPHFGLEITRHWWEDRIPDGMLSDQVQIRRRVQGAALGLEHCQKLAALAMVVCA